MVIVTRLSTALHHMEVQSYRVVRLGKHRDILTKSIDYGVGTVQRMIVVSINVLVNKQDWNALDLALVRVL